MQTNDSSFINSIPASLLTSLNISVSSILPKNLPKSFVNINNYQNYNTNLYSIKHN
jgi:hypothetical protein